MDYALTMEVVNVFNGYPYQYQPLTRQQLIRVNGIDGARAYTMQPNSTVALFDGNCDVMYIKSTDGAGFGNIRAFRFEQIVEKPTEKADYVTRKEYDELKEAIENVKQLVSNKQSAKRDND